MYFNRNGKTQFPINSHMYMDIVYACVYVYVCKQRIINFLFLVLFSYIPICGHCVITENRFFLLFYGASCGEYR